MRLRLGNTKLWLTSFGILVVLWLLAAALLSGVPDIPTVPEDPQAPVGSRTVAATERMMAVQLDSLSGWVPNDLPISPTYLLDNLTHFQLGVLQVARHSSRVLKDNLTRQRTSDAVNPDTDTAFSAYANDPKLWAFPSAESAFTRGNEALKRFKSELGTKTRFYPRADNLVQLLEQLASELGAVSAPLLMANTDQVSWFEIDDNFYMARGVASAMFVLLEAVREDFSAVLRDKNATEITDLILLSLEESQFSPWVITNGDPDGILANHSSNLKAYLDDARQKMNSLITILKQG